ncbi:GNAT family N-acetyltransferase [Plantibacter flavus]|uniref:GNAT family N-acetyltransferase n=1 Tax=Plantibacter flavus TaxID=150123 RepID=UPI003F1812E1
MVTTRPASVDDAATLVGLAAATFALACPPGTAQEHIDAFIAEHFTRERFDGYLGDQDRAITLVIDDEGTPIGYTMLVFGRTQDEDVLAALTQPPSVELSKVYVLPADHGRGTARALMAATLDVVRERGSGAVWLGVNQQNAKAIRFYEKSGFTIVGPKVFHVGPERHDDFVMELVF